MEFEAEAFFICPYCGERISMLLDEVSGPQSYIEDCEVCCKPVQISYELGDEGAVSVRAEKA